jgi:hypothetical protein
MTKGEVGGASGYNSQMRDASDWAASGVSLPRMSFICYITKDKTEVFRSQLAARKIFSSSRRLWRSRRQRAKPEWSHRPGLFGGLSYADTSTDASGLAHEFLLLHETLLTDNLVHGQHEQQPQRQHYGRFPSLRWLYVAPRSLTLLLPLLTAYSGSQPHHGLPRHHDRSLVERRDRAASFLPRVPYRPKGRDLHESPLRQEHGRRAFG